MKKRISYILIVVMLITAMLLGIISCKKEEAPEKSSTVPSGKGSSEPVKSSSEPVKPSSEPVQSSTVPSSSVVPSEPVPSSEPLPSSEPVPSPEPSLEPEPGQQPFMDELMLDFEYHMDIDMDGEMDTFIVKEKKGQYNSTYEIRVKASGVKKEFKKTIEDAYEPHLYYVEKDFDARRIDIFFFCYYESDDEMLTQIRVNKKGNKIISKEYPYVPIGMEDGLLMMESGTDILGTTSIISDYDIINGELMNISGVYYYTGNAKEIEVIEPLPVMVRVSDTALKDENLKKGSKIKPLYTDCKSFVFVELDDGRKAMIQFYIEDGMYIPYIQGKPQDYYLDIEYAD